MSEELEQLKQELELYKRIINSLPVSFTYTDQQSGLSFRKKENLDVDSSAQLENFRVSMEFIEKQLKPIADLIPHHIVFVNGAGIITLCNSKAASDLRVCAEDMIGKHIRELLKLEDDKILLLETLKTNKTITNREVLDKNYGIMSTHIIVDSEGNLERAIGLFLFLNEVKQAEKQAMAGRIAAGIAHEIRNPLTTVRGYLQLLQGRLDSETANLLNTLLIPEIDRANKIISDFLRIAKPSQTHIEEIEAHSFFTDYLANFLSSEALLHNASIFYSIDPQLLNSRILGDKDELLQVFINLYRNSVQAAENKPLQTRISIEIKGDNISISFSDNGKGIPASELQYIFDPFYSTKDEGTGLGLSISRKIIENHKGSMSVASSEKGTTFLIELPYVKKP
ncbi:PAS domain-containing sensor histidine kinase [Bacillus lacus]|uniref:histidine kinase n=1 Tax=Metabacillus lacus TaxID=1983721 RepID=A0A7X2LYB0_9BACI|nr:ATP-binding protein [Metabacillus lacus]MRX71603.1 PAS domain-containing sensor histidine kinase [Metabacillus lacus]